MRPPSSWTLYVALFHTLQAALASEKPVIHIDLCLDVTQSSSLVISTRERESRASTDIGLLLTTVYKNLDYGALPKRKPYPFVLLMSTLLQYISSTLELMFPTNANPSTVALLCRFPSDAMILLLRVYDIWSLNGKVKGMPFQASKSNKLNGALLSCPWSAMAKARAKQRLEGDFEGVVRSNTCSFLPRHSIQLPCQQNPNSNAPFAQKPVASDFDYRKGGIVKEHQLVLLGFWWNCDHCRIGQKCRHRK